MTASGFDLSPLIQLMVLGAVIALGPLAWVWLRHRGQSPARRLRALTLLTLFLTFDLVLFGAFTRLSDSGLGCPDWPGCYGHASPVGAQAPIAQAQQALPDGPVTPVKAWIEMLHRYMATGVGVLILTLLAVRWRERRNSQGLPGLGWPAVTLLAVSVQGAFGALTVTMKLFPAIVTLHLMGGLLLLALLTVQATRYNNAVLGTEPVAVGRGLQFGLVGVGLLLAGQVALGGWVSTNYAVLACQDFPACQNSWWPEMNFQQGFTLWRELGLTATGDAIAFSALTAIHYVHRLAAYVVLLALAGLAWRLHQVKGLRRQARFLALLAVLQLLTGLGNVLLGWPLAAALAHTGGAAAMVMVMVWALASCRVGSTTHVHASAGTDNSAGRKPGTVRRQRSESIA